MRRKIIIIVIFLVIFLVISAILFLTDSIGTQKARLRIESSPVANVYLNGQEVGVTPLEKDVGVGQVTIKLVPSSETHLLSYESKVNLTKGVKTIVKRVLAQTPELSSGVIISFEKENNQGSFISVVTSPDGAAVMLDGRSRGVSPIKISDATAGAHQLTISALGYDEQNFDIQTQKGYRLTAIVTLAANGGPTQPDIAFANQTPSPSPTPTPSQVEILTTPTGFLRVRSGPGQTYEEIGRVEPGKMYEFIEENKELGWVKIKIDETMQGWVSDEFIKTAP